VAGRDRTSELQQQQHWRRVSMERNHQGKRSGVWNRLRVQAHCPPLPSILLANAQSLENRMDDVRVRIRFQWDIRDCNIFCLTETWLIPLVPDEVICPTESFSVFRADRMEESGKSKGGGVCFMTNNWCNPNDIRTPGVQHGHHYSRLHPTTRGHRHGTIGPT